MNPSNTLTKGPKKETQFLAGRTPKFLQTTLLSALFFLLLGVGESWGQTVQTYSTSGTYSWTCPPGVTSVTVQAWGGGGAGGSDNYNNRGSSGGGGGAYSTQTITVTAGTNYTVVVGTGGQPVAYSNGGNGGQSYFINATTVMAVGGGGGLNATNTGGVGGLGSSSVGTTKFSGGNGGVANTSSTAARSGGGGASSAGTAANGANGPTAANGLNAGATAPIGGGNGGNGGVSTTNPVAGVSPGGGGGGAQNWWNGYKLGGAGGSGRVVLTYTEPACSGTPAPGNTLASSSSVVSGGTTNLSLQNATSGSGVTYQWESSTTSSSSGYTDISGATSSTYTATVTANTWYRCKVTCSSSTGTSTATQVTLTYCTPSYTNTTYFINGFSTSGGITNISNSTGTNPLSNSYSNYTSQSCSQIANNSINYSIPLSSSAASGGTGVAIYVDWNKNLVFETSERMTPSLTGYIYATYTGSFTVPNNTAAGDYRMRVVLDYNAYTPVTCALTSSNGEFEDYTFTVVTPSISTSGTINAFTSCSATASAAQSFSVSGTNLGADLVVTAPTGFEVSKTETGTYTSSVSFTPSSGTVSSQSVWVRMAALSSNPTSANITCTSTGATTVNVAVSGTVNSTPVAVTVTGGAICSGGTITASGGTGGTIYWQGTTSGGTSTTSSGTTSPAVTAAGTYYARAKSSAGCWGTEGSASVTITAVPACVATGFSPADGNNSVNPSVGTTITWTAVSDATGYDVYFNGALVSTNQSGTSYSTGALVASTLYTWKVVPKNSCGSASSCSVYSFTTTTACTAPSISSTSTTNINCFGQSTGSITVNASGGSSPYQYSKDNGTTWQASNVFGSLASGSYNIVVKGGDACIGAPSVVSLTQPLAALAVSASGGGSGCANATKTVSSTVSGGTSPYTYSWSNPSGLDNAALASPTATIGSFSSHTLTVTDANGCSATSSAVSITNNSPAAPTASNPAAICAGTPVNIVATSAGNTINWYNDATGGTAITTLVASGANYSVSPSATKTYYAEAVVTTPGSQPFSYTGSIVNWTVPAGVTSINVDARGAQGGNQPQYIYGGRGARIVTNNIVVSPGQVLKILVGQAGVNGASDDGCGGGGGTFLTTSANVPIVIAGGGGGDGADQAGIDASLSTTSTANGDSSRVGSAGPDGGLANDGSGGGGFSGNGANGLTTTSGGYSFTNGGAGGVGLRNGGYGGGGAGGTSTEGGGGGGGYAGGPGGSSSTDAGGGGSSYSITSPTTSAATQTGDGSLLITYQIVGCASSRTAVVVAVNEAPTANSGAALNSICAGQTTAAMGGSIGGTATSGTWSGGTGTWTNATDYVNATYTAGASESGTITLTLTPSGTGSCTGVPATKTIVVNALPIANAGTDTTICSGSSTRLVSSSPDLSSVLSAINSNQASLISSIPTPYGFVMDATGGVNGNYISDGTGDMYDSGNYINTNLGSTISYSDNNIVSNSAFGSGGKYFTRVIGNQASSTTVPTIFYWAADLNGLSSVSITGGNGADGTGSQDLNSFSINANGIDYTCFLKRVYNAGDPSINHLFIVPNPNSATQSMGTTTDDDLHTISGLSGVNRMYYMLYAGSSGTAISVAAATSIAQTFVNIIPVATYSWSSSPVGFTSTSANPSVSPTSTTTYSLTLTNNGCTSLSDDVIVTVNQPSVAPTSLSASTATICNGNNTTLTQTGGSLGTGAVWQWYTNNTFTTTVGGTLSSSNASLSVSPTTTTTYYLRAISGTSPCAASVPATTPSTVSVTVTVNQPSVAPTSLSASTATICNGNNTTLTQTGGSLGTGAVWQWYTNNTFTTTVGGTLSSSNASLSVSPTTTTTYYLRAISGTSPCAASVPATTPSTVSVTVTVNQPSVAPTSLSASTATICNGNNTTLTQTGGSLGTGAVWQWYTNNTFTTTVGGTLSSSNASLSVSPTTTTTYYLRAISGTSPCAASVPATTPSTVSVTVTVNQPSVAPTSISGTTTICNNQSTSLTANGGTVGTGANYQWGTGSTVGSSIISGETASTLSVSPTSTTTYWVRITNGTSPCSASTDGVTATVTVNPTTTITAQSTAAQSVCNGAGFSPISVTATGTGTLTYQWYSNGANSNTGGTSLGASGQLASYTPSSSTDGTKYYYCVVTGTCGSATSVVSGAFEVKSLPSQATATSTNSCGTATLTAIAAGSASVTWYSDALGTTAVSVAGASSTLTINDASAATTYYAYTSQNGCRSLNYYAAQLELKPTSIYTDVSGDHSWFTASNWDCNVVPTASTNVIIPTAKIVNIDGAAAVANTIVLQGTANVIVTTNDSMSVTNKVTVASGATFTIQDNASLVQTDNVANEGVITVKKSTPVERKLKIFDAVLWSSPVAQKLKAVSPGTTDNYFLQYNTSTDSWAAVTTPASHDVIGGRGYLVRTPTTTGSTTQVFDYTTPQQWNVDFIGTPNNGPVTYTNTATNIGDVETYVLVGNPYPSAISISAFKAANPNITGVFYFFRKPNGVTSISAYGTLDADGTFASNDANNTIGAINPAGVIPSGQGFFVTMRTDDAATNYVNNGQIYFTNTMRLSSSHGTLNRINTATDLYKLTVKTTGIGNSQLFVKYKPESTLGYDIGSDAVAFTDGATDLSSIMNNEYYRIQARGDYNTADVVPLQFKTGLSGEHRISLSDASGVFAADQMVIIKDNLTGVQHNLTANGDYVFTSATGTFTNRFEVIYQQAYYTALQANSCGATIANMSSLVYADIVNGATGYRFKVVNNTTAAVQTIDRPQHWFAFNMLSAYDYNTPYTISVQVQKDGVWTGYYGATCTVNSPNIAATGIMQINPSQCGMTLPTLGTVIATTPVAGATGYKFRITNTTANAMGNNLVQEVTRTNHWFTLAMLTRYNYGSSYAIEVAVKTTGGYTPYGNACTVYAPAVPTLASCGQTVATATTLVRTTATNLATQYRFQVTRIATQETITFDTANYWFSFRVNVPGYAAGEQYGVRVAVMTAGAWSPYGDACDITAPIATARTTEEAAPSEANLFKPVAYPNPFKSDFSIALATPFQDDVTLVVYDLQGRLIEKQTIPVTLIDTIHIGANYQMGDYMLVVSQGPAIESMLLHKE